MLKRFTNPVLYVLYVVWQTLLHELSVDSVMPFTQHAAHNSPLQLRIFKKKSQINSKSVFTYREEKMRLRKIKVTSRAGMAMLGHKKAV